MTDLSPTVRPEPAGERLRLRRDGGSQLAGHYCTSGEGVRRRAAAVRGEPGPACRRDDVRWEQQRWERRRLRCRPLPRARLVRSEGNAAMFV